MIWRVMFFVFFLLLVYAHLSFGTILIDPFQVLGGSGPDAHAQVLFSIRLPRLVGVVSVGAALAMVGALFQAIFRNPLADPSLIGVSSGGALGASLALLLGWATFGVPVFAFFGAVLFIFIAVGVANVGGKFSVPLMLLAGIGLNALSGAVISLFLYFSDDNALRGMLFWNLGSFALLSWAESLVLLVVMGISVLIFPLYGRFLDVLAFGDEQAQSLGYQTQRSSMLLLILGALAVALTVSFAGIIGFVGLFVPHIVRILFGKSYSSILPWSALGGASLTLIADLVAKTSLAPMDIPVGIVTALLGIPFFFYLLIRRNRRGSWT